MSLSIIAALDRNGLIGKQGALPWDIPEDLAWFKQQTLGKTVVMGRKTWEAIGKILPQRKNIIQSSSSLTVEGAESIHSIQAVLDFARQEDVFVIGGAEVFKLTLPYADYLYISRIDGVYQGDTYFPAYDVSEWVLLSHEAVLTKSSIKLSFNIYQRLQ